MLVKLARDWWGLVINNFSAFSWMKRRKAMVVFRYRINRRPIRTLLYVYTEVFAGEVDFLLFHLKIVSLVK